VVTIPRSGTAKRIVSNSKIFDFDLKEEDILQIDRLNLNQPMVQRRVHLLEMLSSQKFDKRLVYLLSNAVGDRLQQTFSLKTPV
jgi:hypothetical protein